MSNNNLILLDDGLYVMEKSSFSEDAPKYKKLINTDSNQIQDRYKTKPEDLIPKFKSLSPYTFEIDEKEVSTKKIPFKTSTQIILSLAATIFSQDILPEGSFINIGMFQKSDGEIHPIIPKQRIDEDGTVIEEDEKFIEAMKNEYMIARFIIVGKSHNEKQIDPNRTEGFELPTHQLYVFKNLGNDFSFNFKRSFSSLAYLEGLQSGENMIETPLSLASEYIELPIQNPVNDSVIKSLEGTFSESEIANDNSYQMLDVSMKLNDLSNKMIFKTAVKLLDTNHDSRQKNNSLDNDNALKSDEIQPETSSTFKENEKSNDDVPSDVLKEQQTVQSTKNLEDKDTVNKGDGHNEKQIDPLDALTGEFDAKKVDDDIDVFGNQSSNDVPKDITPVNRITSVGNAKKISVPTDPDEYDSDDQNVGGFDPKDFPAAKNDLEEGRKELKEKVNNGEINGDVFDFLSIAGKDDKE